MPDRWFHVGHFISNCESRSWTRTKEREEEEEVDVQRRAQFSSESNEQPSTVDVFQERKISTRKFLFFELTFESCRSFIQAPETKKFDDKSFRLLLNVKQAAILLRIETNKDPSNILAQLKNQEKQFSGPAEQKTWTTVLLESAESKCEFNRFVVWPV